MINVSAEGTDYRSALGIVISLCAMFYLAAAIAERFNLKMKKWHRIKPGTPTDLDEAEWKRLDNARPEDAAVLDQKIIPPGQKFATGRPAAPIPGAPVQSAENPPPESRRPQTETVLYDSGFDETAGKKAEPEGEDEFDDVFGVKKDD